MLDLKTALSNLPIKDQYDIMARLQNPNNVNGAPPAVEYASVRDCFTSNLSEYYANNVTFQEAFVQQISHFSTDQLASLKAALAHTASNNFAVNPELNQNGRNVLSNRFDGYVNYIDEILTKEQDQEREF
jgi:hypothetical protein